MKKKNFIFTTISISSRLIAGLLLFILLARVWGPDDFGLFSYVFASSMLLALLVDFGFASYLLREIGGKPSHLVPVFRDGLRAKLILIVPFSLIGSLIVWLYGAALPWEMMIPMLLSALFLSFGEYFVATLRAINQYGLETAVITSSNLINFTMAGGVAWLGGSPYDVAWVSLLGRTQYLLTAAWILYRVAPEITHYQDKITSIRQTFRQVLPYGTDGFLSTSWGQLDVVIVGSLFGTHTLGIYSAGQKMVQGLYTIAQVVGNVMIPRLASLVQNCSLDFARSNLVTMISLSAIGLCFSLPLWVWANELPLLLFGERFYGLTELLPLFSIILLMKYISAGSGIVMTAVGMQVHRVKGQIYGILAFLLGSLLMALIQPTLFSFLICYAFGVFVMTVLFQFSWIKLTHSFISKIGR